MFETVTKANNQSAREGAFRKDGHKIQRIPIIEVSQHVEKESSKVVCPAAHQRRAAHTRRNVVLSPVGSYSFGRCVPVELSGCHDFSALRVCYRSPAPNQPVAEVRRRCYPGQELLSRKAYRARENNGTLPQPRRVSKILKGKTKFEGFIEIEGLSKLKDHRDRRVINIKG